MNGQSGICYTLRLNNMPSYKIINNDNTFIIDEHLNVIDCEKEFELCSIWKMSDSGIELVEKIRSHTINSLLEEHIFFPTKAIFLLTSRCNLDCKYCYSKFNNIEYDLSFKQAEGVISKILQNVIMLNKKTLRIGFHGGGEPFIKFTLMERIVDFARSIAKVNGLDLLISATTNGILSFNQRIWASNNVDKLKISFDGTADLQNQNRPLKQKKSESMTKLLQTIQHFNMLQYPYTLRTTITCDSLHKMNEIMNYSKCISNDNIIKFEAKYTRDKNNYSFSKLNLDVNLLSFLKNYYSLKTKNPKLNSFDACDTSYQRCGAWGNELILDGYGNISTCFKCTSYGDKSPFFICMLDEFLNTNIMLSKKHMIRKINLKANQICSYCFIWGRCGGGCLTLWGNDKRGDQIYTPTQRCNVLRNYFLSKFK